MKKLLSEPVRTYLYGVLVPGIAVLTGYGIVSESEASLWTALGAAILGVPAVESARKRVRPSVSSSKDEG